MTIAAGTKLGHYEIVSKIGEGGMGEVYLSQDTKLDRKVALKILPADVASNRDRMDRFVREAKSAAALNHPHIAHIYEIGESGSSPTVREGVHFIAMEYIDGETLREKIHRDKAPLPKLLKYLTQIAEGLSKAHSAGIVHRDLKPDNIMITRDGFAKILDFGLAKLVEPQRSFDASDSGSSEIATAVMAQQSTPGMVMGTVGYMSPEQAQGKTKEIDHRSDVFSFGCILFEAATGKRAFEGKDVLDSLHKIVHAPTPQIKDFTASAPDELQRIVRRCLAKEPDKRYQSIKEVAIELEELQQELKGASELEYSAQPTSSSAAASIAAAQTESVHSSASGAGSIGTALSTSSAEYLVGEIKRHKLGALLAIGAFAVVFAGAGFGIYKWIGSNRGSEAPRALKITRLTTSGRAPRAAISPDGKYVVYVQMGEGRRQSLWLRQVSTSSDVQILPEDGAAYRGITFSANGDFIFYVRNENAGLSHGALWRSPVLGSNPRKLIDDVDSYISLSPDGKQVTFVRPDPDGLGESLMVANIDGSGEKKLASRKSPNNFTGSSPSWSPDGQTIAIGQEDVTGGIFRSVVGVRVEDGTEQPFTDRKWSGNYTPDLAWLSDNSGVLVTASEQAGSNPQIWFLAWPGNEARQVTSDLSAFSNVSVTSDSSTVCAVRSESITNLWVADNTDLDNAQPITSGAERFDGANGISWTPDGRIIFSSQAGGEQNIWIVGADGGGNRQISSSARRNRAPAVSPDGRYIIWQSNRGSGLTLWRMNIDGGSPKQLTKGGSDYEPQISPDGKWVVFTRVEPGRFKVGLWKVSLEGGEAMPIVGGSSTSWSNVVSPDGTKIAYTEAGSRGNYSKIVVIPFEGGPPIVSLDFPEREDNPGGGDPRIIQWTADGRAIAFIRDVKGQSNIWTLPLDGGAPKQLTHYKDLAIRNFAWSRDGKKLALSRGSSTRDVVLIKNFR
jgi:serine/threonine protein kinase/Tol biopolymer transport system component